MTESLGFSLPSSLTTRWKLSNYPKDNTVSVFSLLFASLATGVLPTRWSFPIGLPKSYKSKRRDDEKIWSIDSLGSKLDTRLTAGFWNRPLLRNWSFICTTLHATNYYEFFSNLPEWPLKVTQLFVFRCQALTVLSSEPDMTLSPSHVNTRQRTELIWPSYTAWHSPELSDHTLSVLSLEPVMISSFGDIAIALIGPK